MEQEDCDHPAAVLKIEAPEVKVRAIQCDELPPGWQSRLDFTREFGTAWLQKETALLQVPSAIVPETANFLLNPTHPDAKKFKVIAVSSYPFDVRPKK